ncbi:hypothetical protein ACSXEW_16055 (plasmid) [Clostridium perfringens]
MEKVSKVFGRLYSKTKRKSTHVLLSINEYNELINKLNSILDKKEELQKNLNRIITEKEVVQNNLNSLINRNNILQNKLNVLQRMIEKERESLKEDITSIKLEKDRINQLNINLIRIMKERANSKRGIKPKKTHNGYLIIESKQYEKNYYLKNELIRLKCWKIKIQSPYNSSIPYEIVQKEIEMDLKNILNEKLGISKIYNNISGESIEMLIKRSNTNENFIFESNYKSNFVEGFWEIEYLSKDNIVFPTDMT